MDIEKNLNSISKKLSNYDAKLIPVIKNRTVEEVKQFMTMVLENLAKIGLKIIICIQKILMMLSFTLLPLFNLEKLKVFLKILNLFIL